MNFTDDKDHNKEEETPVTKKCTCPYQGRNNNKLRTEIGSISWVQDEKVFNQISRGELYDYLHLEAKWSAHSEICLECAGSRVLLNSRPVHGAIAKRILNSIEGVKVGPGLYEIQYTVLMKRPGILGKLFPSNTAVKRYEAAVKQTGSLIRGKLKKHEGWAIEKINETIESEINEGKNCRSYPGNCLWKRARQAL